MGALNLVFDSDTMWVLVLAGLAACMLSRVNGTVSLGNALPGSREPVAGFSEEDSDLIEINPALVETLFMQQAPPRVNGEDIDEFLVDVSGIVGKV